MASVAHKSFFSVDFVHTFYKSGFTQDIDFAPTKETEEKMRNAKLLLRSTNTGMKMFYRSVSPSNAVAFNTIDNDVFTFALSLNNTVSFLNFTDLTTQSSKKYTSGKILHFRNNNVNTAALSYDLLDFITPSLFTFDFTLTNPATGNVTVEVKDAAGTTTVIPVSDPLVDVNGLYSYQVDLRNYPKGKYQLLVVDSGDNSNNQTVLAYVDSDLAGKQIFGILEINYPSSISFASFIALPAYTVNFVRRLSTWKYFVVLKSGNTLISDSSVTIVDESLDSTNSDNPYDDFSFAKTTSTVNGIDAFVFTTIAPSLTVPFFETAKRKLRLKKNNNSNVLTTIIDELPNPTIGSISADPAYISKTFIYVYI